MVRFRQKNAFHSDLKDTQVVFGKYGIRQKHHSLDVRIMNAEVEHFVRIEETSTIKGPPFSNNILKLLLALFGE